VCWPQELLDLGDTDDLPDPETDLQRWLWLATGGSRDAWQDMADFADALGDPAASRDLQAAIHGRGAFARFQQTLDRHSEFRASWRVHSSERRTGRARATLSEAGYDAVPQ
jgi:hypothetical protein